MRRKFLLAGLLGAFALGTTIVNGTAEASIARPSATTAVATCARSVLTSDTNENFIVKSEAAIGTLENLTAKYEKQPGFLALVPSKSGGKPYLVVDSSASPKLRGDASADGLQVVDSCIATTEITATTNAVFGQKHSRTDFSIVGYMPYEDRILVDTTLPLAATQASIDPVVSRGRQSDAIRIQQERPGRLNKSGGRFADFSPHYGASQILVGGVNRCSAGFAIRNTLGQRGIMTAGHCSTGLFNNGDLVLNGAGNGSASGQFGTVVFNSYPDPDLMAISGNSYSGFVYNWIDDTTSIRVSGSGDPVIGASYCQYGNPSLRICTGYVSLNVSSMDENGFISSNLAYALSAPGCPFGVLVQPGDSGGPVGFERGNGTTSARGSVKGGLSPDANNRCTRLDHKWSTIASIFNVTIVNG